MKGKIYYIFIMFVVIFQFASVSGNDAKASESGDVRSVVIEFLHYLKNGNTDGVLSLITDPMLSERKVVLGRNPNYPVMLMDAYKKTDFQIMSVEKLDNLHYSVVVDSIVGDEIVKKTEFICQKDDDSWKISEEIRKGV
ncbi:MAG: hypothetical protein WBB19_02760 [Desulforhopalus sp.]